jgi:16S rRNA (guanine(966)-N(2))-methyltransferase RsmD
LRIVSGKLKGLRFKPPKSFPSRPTTDFAKEALFNILHHEFELDDIDVLDLCSGTGSISLEFASREARTVTSVDNHGKSLAFLAGRAKKYDLKQITTYKQDLLHFMLQTEKQYDIIFADPPFASTFYQEIPTLVFERKLLKTDGLLIIEHGRENSFDQLPQFMYMRNYGGVQFSFFTEVTADSAEV